MTRSEKFQETMISISVFLFLAFSFYIAAFLLFIVRYGINWRDAPSAKWFSIFN